MRTAIFLGCITIADAINKNWFPNTDAGKAMVVIALLIFAIMDGIEFINKLTKK